METIPNFDVSLVELNLSLSPEERLKQHQLALDLLLEIQNVKDHLDEKSKSSA